jgi:hypothetical protein
MDRVTYESHAEEVLGNAIGDAMAETAWPGIFSGGKQIVHTRYVKDPSGQQDDLISLGFDDGSEMNITGRFEVRYKLPSGDVVAETDLNKMAEANTEAFKRRHFPELLPAEDTEDPV